MPFLNREKWLTYAHCLMNSTLNQVELFLELSIRNKIIVRHFDSADLPLMSQKRENFTT